MEVVAVKVMLLVVEVVVVEVVVVVVVVVVEVLVVVVIVMEFGETKLSGVGSIRKHSKNAQKHCSGHHNNHACCEFGSRHGQHSESNLGCCGRSAMS